MSHRPRSAGGDKSRSRPSSGRRGPERSETPMSIADSLDWDMYDVEGALSDAPALSPTVEAPELGETSYDGEPMEIMAAGRHS